MSESHQNKPDEVECEEQSSPSSIDANSDDEGRGKSSPQESSEVFVTDLTAEEPIDDIAEISPPNEETCLSSDVAIIINPTDLARSARKQSSVLDTVELSSQIANASAIDAQNDQKKTAEVREETTIDANLAKLPPPSYVGPKGQQSDEDEIDHRPIEGRTEHDEISARLKRRKSMMLTDDVIRKDSTDSYRITIPLRKKVNKSTKKKLWREIERRKPFLTRNVADHIRNYAKPPFITWGCRNCEFTV